MKSMPTSLKEYLIVANKLAESEVCVDDMDDLGPDRTRQILNQMVKEGHAKRKRHNASRTPIGGYSSAFYSYACEPEALKHFRRQWKKLSRDTSADIDFAESLLSFSETGQRVDETQSASTVKRRRARSALLNLSSSLRSIVSRDRRCDDELKILLRDDLADFSGSDFETDWFLAGDARTRLVGLTNDDYSTAKGLGAGVAYWLNFITSHIASDLAADNLGKAMQRSPATKALFKLLSSSARQRRLADKKLVDTLLLCDKDLELSPAIEVLWGRYNTSHLAEALFKKATGKDVIDSIRRAIENLWAASPGSRFPVEPCIERAKELGILDELIAPFASDIDTSESNKRLDIQLAALLGSGLGESIASRLIAQGRPTRSVYHAVLRHKPDHISNRLRIDFALDNYWTLTIDDDLAGFDRTEVLSVANEKIFDRKDWTTIAAVFASLRYDLHQNNQSIEYWMPVFERLKADSESILGYLALTALERSKQNLSPVIFPRDLEMNHGFEELQIPVPNPALFENLRAMLSQSGDALGDSLGLLEVEHWIPLVGATLHHDAPDWAFPLIADNLAVCGSILLDEGWIVTEWVYRLKKQRGIG